MIFTYNKEYVGDVLMVIVAEIKELNWQLSARDEWRVFTVKTMARQ